MRTSVYVRLLLCPEEETRKSLQVLPCRTLSLATRVLGARGIDHELLRCRASSWTGAQIADYCGTKFARTSRIAQDF